MDYLTYTWTYYRTEYSRVSIVDTDGHNTIRYIAYVMWFG